MLLLASGRVKIHHITSEGKQALLAIIDPGEMFGELAIFESGEREEFAEAMERSTVVMIPRAEIQKLIESHPDISLRVTKLMGMRRRRIERHLKSLLFRSNRERLGDLLVELLEKYVHQSGGSQEIAIKLSHQDLAGIIGSTRETVTVLLGELQSEGFLKLMRRRVVITNLAGLARSIGTKLPQGVAVEEVRNPMLRQAQLGS